MEHYEASEKRLELTLAPDSKPLRALGRKAWDKVAAAAGAKVLSRLSTEACEARLLSESSLFVWDDRVVMTTCGRTTLAAAVVEMLRVIPKTSVRSLLYERRRERFPDRQPSSFLEDARILRRLLPGRTRRFGRRLSLYRFGRRPAQAPPTVELIMHGVQAAGGLPKTLRGLLCGFKTDEHFFRPSGYSLNALSGKRYCAVHWTPDGADSYASFETDACTDESLGEVLRLFRPRCYDLVRIGRKTVFRHCAGTAGRRPAGRRR